MLLCAALLCSDHARASDLALGWRAPASCPDLAELQASLRSRLSRPLTFGPDAPTQLDGRVEREGDGFRLTLDTRTESGSESRILEAGSCNELARATLLVASLLLSTRPLPAEAQRAAPEAARPSTPRSLRLLVGVAPVIDFGRLPAPAPGLAARVGLQRSRLRIAAGALYLPEQWRSVAGQPGAAIGLQLTAAQLCVCYVLLESPALGTCARGELGALAAQGRGLADSQRSSSLWLAGGLGLGVWLPLTPWLELSTELGLDAPLMRAQLSVHELGSVYRVPAIAGQLQVGLSLRFP